MRHNETHFEQIPIAVVETALHECALQKGMPEELPALVLMPEDAAVSEFVKRDESKPLKGKS